MEERVESDVYTLDELSSLTGFDRRVIRSFIEQGLLRGANSMGRYARYSSYHLSRLLAIKILKEHQGLSLAAIRTALVTMSEDEMTNMVARSSGFHLNLPIINMAPSASPPSHIIPSNQAKAVDDDLPDPPAPDVEPEKLASEPLEESKPDLQSILKSALEERPELAPANESVPTVEDDESEELSSEPSVDDEKAKRDGTIYGSVDFSRLSQKKQVQPPPLTALDYIKALGKPQKEPPSAPVVAQKQAAPKQAEVQRQIEVERPEQREKKLQEQRVTGQTPIDLLLAELSKVHEQRTVRRQAKSEQWYRIAITPDIELSVRGINDSEQLARLERVADHIREILLGGHYD